MKFTFPPDAQPLPGIRIRRGIQRGGFGEVYQAVTDGGKDVALKLLTQHREIELRGIQQCLNLKHPNLLTLFDVKTDADGDWWVVMEYITGPSLEETLYAFPNGLPLPEIHAWLDGLCRGAAFLHHRGIVHRDLKPANVYREHGVVKVADVGLSKLIGPDRKDFQTQSVGTVYYMAPEVVHGRYGCEVDVYSLGVMLYEMLVGRVPFQGETTGEILLKQLTQQPDLRPIRPELRGCLGRALAKDPAERTPTAMDLLADFERATGLSQDSRDRSLGERSQDDALAQAAAADPQPRRPQNPAAALRIADPTGSLTPRAALNPFANAAAIGGVEAFGGFGAAAVPSPQAESVQPVAATVPPPIPRAAFAETAPHAVDPARMASPGTPANRAPKVWFERLWIDWPDKFRGPDPLAVQFLAQALRLVILWLGCAALGGITILLAQPPIHTPLPILACLVIFAALIGWIRICFREEIWPPLGELRAALRQHQQRVLAGVATEPASRVFGEVLGRWWARLEPGDLWAVRWVLFAIVIWMAGLLAVALSGFPPRPDAGGGSAFLWLLGSLVGCWVVTRWVRLARSMPRPQSAGAKRPAESGAQANDWGQFGGLMIVGFVLQIHGFRHGPEDAGFAIPEFLLATGCYVLAATRLIAATRRRALAKPLRDDLPAQLKVPAGAELPTADFATAAAAVAAAVPAGTVPALAAGVAASPERGGSVEAPHVAFGRLKSWTTGKSRSRSDDEVVLRPLNLRTRLGTLLEVIGRISLLSLLLVPLAIGAARFVFGDSAYPLSTPLELLHLCLLVSGLASALAAAAICWPDVKQRPLWPLGLLTAAVGVGGWWLQQELDVAFSRSLWITTGAINAIGVHRLTDAQGQPAALGYLVFCLFVAVLNWGWQPRPRISLFAIGFSAVLGYGFGVLVLFPQLLAAVWLASAVAIAQLGCPRHFLWTTAGELRRLAEREVRVPHDPPVAAAAPSIEATEGAR